MCQICHDCFVEISVVTSGAVVQFPENNRIRDSKVKSIQVRRANGQTKYDILGRTLAADTVVYGAHVTLNDGSGAPLLQMPVEDLWRDTNSPEPLCTKYDRIDPTQSLININTAAAGYNAAHVIEFVFELECNNC